MIYYCHDTTHAKATGNQLNLDFLDLLLDFLQKLFLLEDTFPKQNLHREVEILGHLLQHSCIRFMESSSYVGSDLYFCWSTP